MNARLRVIGAALLVLGALLTGCRSYSSCSEPSNYGSGESIPPLEIPPGLEPPDTRNALKIPELAEPERPRTDAEGCLDQPPSYFPDRRVGEPVPAK